MKNLSIIQKIIYFVNLLVAIALLLTYAVPYIKPTAIPMVSVLSLGVPIVLAINLFFAIYWAVQFKKQFLLSTICLLIGIQFITTFYNFTEKKIVLNDDIKIMSYNVRLFNKYDWIAEKDIEKNISEFIQKKNVGIVCLQEYVPLKKNKIKYPYQYSKATNKQNGYGQIIYSKYPIIHKGSLDFDHSNNNAIYADIKINKDTVRVYNVHLESLKLNLSKDNFGEENKEVLLQRVQGTFEKQTKQVEEIMAHESKSPYKTIVCADMNNTAFSWAYRCLKADKKDAFEIAGKGLGKTYDYTLPMRIDFIFVDPSIPVHHFKTYSEKYSDHFPIIARIPAF